MNIFKNILLFFFFSDNYKPTTLWSIQSQIKRVLLNETKQELKLPLTKLYLKGLEKVHLKKKIIYFYKKQVIMFLTWEEETCEILRLKVVMIVGIYGGLRICEIVDLTWIDIKKDNEEYSITINKSKTDQKGEKFIFKVTKWETLLNSKYCPVAILDRYINLIPNNIKEKCRFIVSVTKDKLKYMKQNCGRNKIGLFPSDTAKILKEKDFSITNEDLEHYTGHCYRRSMGTILADMGISIENLRRIGRWKNIKTAEEYIDRSESGFRKISNLFNPNEKELPQNIINKEKTLQKISEKI